MNHPYYPSVSAQGRANSGITALDHAALEFMKELILESEYGVENAARLAEDAFVYASEYMRVKDSHRLNAGY